MTRRSDIFAAIAAAVVGAAACSGPHGAAIGTTREARCGFGVMAQAALDGVLDECLAEGEKLK